MNRREAIAALTSLPALSSVSVASLKPKDVVVVECDHILRVDQIARMRDTLKTVWPDNEIVVCERGVRLKVVEG